MRSELRLVNVPIYEALAPPLDTFEHILDAVRGVERELAEGQIGRRVGEGRHWGLRLVALLHYIAKPVTRSEIEGRMLFVAHDTLRVRLIHRVCRRLKLSTSLTDLSVTLTRLLHRIGFMDKPPSGCARERVAHAAGSFGEELAILCRADHFAVQDPHLVPEHIERHRELCVEFLRESRDLGPYPALAYEELAGRLSHPLDADGVYAASRVRLLQARGLAEDVVIRHVARLAGGRT